MIHVETKGSPSGESGDLPGLPVQAVPHSQTAKEGTGNLPDTRGPAGKA